MMYLSNVMYYTSIYFNALALTNPEHGTGINQRDLNYDLYFS